MAFSADELRVVRRALAEALHPTTTPATTDATPDQSPALADPAWAEAVQEYVRLAEAVEEAAREGGRMRRFALADLHRYRTALPGSAGGYLERLTEALHGGYVPTPADLSALRSLRALPCGSEERARRTDLLRRCHQLAELRGRSETPTVPRRAPVPAAPTLGGLGRGRAIDVLLRASPHEALRGAAEPGQPGEPATPEPATSEPAAPKPKPKPKPGPPQPGPREPAAPQPEPTPSPEPAPAQEPAQRGRRRTPTPAEIWPPRRQPPPREPEREREPDRERDREGDDRLAPGRGPATRLGRAHPSPAHPSPDRLELATG